MSSGRGLARSRIPPASATVSVISTGPQHRLPDSAPGMRGGRLVDMQVTIRKYKAH